jgi:hypothetical protein
MRHSRHAADRKQPRGRCRARARRPLGAVFLAWMCFLFLRMPGAVSACPDPVCIRGDSTSVPRGTPDSRALRLDAKGPAVSLTQTPPYSQHAPSVREDERPGPVLSMVSVTKKGASTSPNVIV